MAASIATPMAESGRTPAAVFIEVPASRYLPPTAADDLPLSPFGAAIWLKKLEWCLGPDVSPAIAGVLQGTTPPIKLPAAALEQRWPKQESRPEDKPRPRRGPRPKKRDEVKELMRSALACRRVTKQALTEEKEEVLASEYGVSRDTARRARREVLAEFVDN
jgi:hypothetical protein